MNVQLTVDVLVWRLENNQAEILFIQRGHDPFVDMFALPGGRFQDEDESLAHTAKRELVEETGIDVNVEDLVFIEYLDQPNRDPRKRTIGFVFATRYNGQEIEAKDDAKAYKWIRVTDVIDLDFDKSSITLAFDHNLIVSYWYQKLLYDRM